MKWLCRHTSVLVDQCVLADGSNALHIAARKNLHRLLKVVLKRVGAQADDDADAFSRLHTLLSTATTMSSGFTPLHEAVMSAENLACVSMLAEVCGDAGLNVTDKAGRTPLLLAIALDRYECAQALLARGANPTLSRTADQSTPLLLACQVAHLPLVKNLLKHKADPANPALCGRTATGMTPLFVAVQQQRRHMVQYLLAAINAYPDSGVAMAAVNTRTDDGITLLLSSALSGSTAIMQALLQAGARPTRLSYGVDGRTEASILAMVGDYNALDLLIGNKMGPAPDRQYRCGEHKETYLEIFSRMHGVSLGLVLDAAAHADRLWAKHKLEDELLALVAEAKTMYDDFLRTNIRRVATAATSTPLGALVIAHCRQDGDEQADAEQMIIRHVLTRLGRLDDYYEFELDTVVLLERQRRHGPLVAQPSEADIMAAEAALGPRYLHSSIGTLKNWDEPDNKHPFAKMFRRLLLLRTVRRANTIRVGGEEIVLNSKQPPRSQLFLMVRADHTDAVIRLSELVDVTSKIRNEDGATPLIVAVKNNSVATLRALLALGAQVDEVSSEEGDAGPQTAMMWAVLRRNSAAFKVVDRCEWVGLAGVSVKIFLVILDCRFFTPFQSIPSRSHSPIHNPCCLFAHPFVQVFAH